MFILSLHFNRYEYDVMSFASADILAISWFTTLCAYRFRNWYMLRPELPAATDASLRPNLLEIKWSNEHSKLYLQKRGWRESTIFESPDLKAPVTWQDMNGHGRTWMDMAGRLCVEVPSCEGSDSSRSSKPCFPQRCFLSVSLVFVAFFVDTCWHTNYIIDYHQYESHKRLKQHPVWEWLIVSYQRHSYKERSKCV